MYSYPVIHPIVTGLLLPSLNSITSKDLQLQEAGCNSRTNLTNWIAIRVCLFCKVRNLLFGQTDQEKQSSRKICQCVLQNVYRKKQYHIPASYLCRKIEVSVKENIFLKGFVEQLQVLHDYVFSFLNSWK